MPSRPSRSAFAIAALPALVFALVSCESPTAPKLPSILYTGSVVQGAIRSLRDTTRYVLDLTGGGDAIVFFVVQGEQLRLTVYDAAGETVAVISDAHNVTDPQRRFTPVIKGSPGRYLIEVSSVASDGTNAFEIRVAALSRAPEHVSATLAIGTIVTGEDLAHKFDVDSFTVSAPQNQLVIVYLRKTTPNKAVVNASIYVSPYGYPFNVWTGPADTVLGAIATGRVMLQAGVRYTVLVTYEMAYEIPDSVPTPYELQVRAIDRAPESGPAALAPLDTVLGAIDYTGDVDDYTLTGVPGAKFNLFVDAGGTAPHGVVATVVRNADSVKTVSAVAGGSSLADKASGVFELPASGMVTIHVTDQNDRSSAYRGPYRVLVYPVDPRPDGVPADLMLDQVTAGRIDMLGDVDEFRLTVARDTTINFIVRRADTDGHELDFSLLNVRDSLIAVTTFGRYNFDRADTAGMGALGLHPGEYRIRVEGRQSIPGGFVGDYEILPRTVNTAPESRPPTINVGDTISDQRIDAPGDIDRFHVTLTAADSVYLTLSWPAIDGVPVRGFLRDAATDTVIAVAGRLASIRTTGDYYVEVRGETRGIDQAEQGAYILRLNRANFAPEDRPPQVALGDTVRSRIDVPGDVDEYLLSAPAGSTVTGALRWDDQSIVNVWIEFFDPTTGAFLDRAHVNHESVGHVIVPAGGALRLRVWEYSQPCEYWCTGPTVAGPYHFVLTQLDRGPETRSATFAVGDTVSGEWIDPAGDIDEYSFAGTAGDTVDVYFQTPQGTWSYQGVVLTLIDLATNTNLGSVSSNGSTDRLEDIAISRTVLPSTGNYQIRVEGGDRHYSKGLYRFRVARSGS